MTENIWSIVGNTTNIYLKNIVSYEVHNYFQYFFEFDIVFCFHDIYIYGKAE